MQFISGIPIQQSIENILYDLQSEINNGLLKDIKPSGNNIMVTCPIHADGMENNPSCGVTAYEMRREDSSKMEAGTANCFTCGYVASLPELISNILGYDDRGRQGFKWLSGRYQFVDVMHREPIKIVTGTRDETNTAQEIQNYVPEEELAGYRLIHPYMYRRGLTDKYIEIFDVGYCEKSDSITFPINNAAGETLFIQKRSVQGKRFENDANASKSTLYGIDVLMRLAPEAKEVVIVESPIDVITLWQWNIPALGTMQAIPTQQQLDLINSLSARTITLAQDNDNAGDVGATRMRDKLNKLTRRVIFPPHAADVNEMTREEYLEAPKEVAFERIDKLNNG